MARTEPFVLHSISQPVFNHIYRFDNIEKNDTESFPLAKNAMVMQIVNHPKYKEQFNGPEPCDSCGGRTRNSVACVPSKCLTFMEGFECSQHCHGNKCGNRRMSRNDYVDVMRVVASSVEPTQYGLTVRKPVEPGNLIGEFLGILKIGDRLPEGKGQFCVPVGNLFHNGKQPLLYLDASQKGNVARHLQTSCQTNCKYVTLICDKEYRVAIIATQKINVGDELFVEKPALLGIRQKCVCAKDGITIGNRTGRNNCMVIQKREMNYTLGPVRLSLTRKNRAAKRRVTFAIPISAFMPQVGNNHDGL